MGLWSAATWVALVACALPAAAAAGEPLDLVPRDALACWVGRPLPDLPPLTSQPATWQTLLEVGTRLAGRPLDHEAQLGLRAAEMFALMIRRSHAIALIDATAKPTRTDPAARRVDRLRIAVVVRAREGSADNGGSNNDRAAFEPFLQIIQKAVNEQTNSGAATLETRRAESWTYQELRDRRLPEWAAIAWGQIDGYFVLTIGPDVWPAVAAVAAGQAPALSGDPWYAAAREPRRRTALIEILVAVQAVRARLDPFLDGRAGLFLDVWNLGHFEQAHWALGLDGRALYCLGQFRHGDTTERRLYADPDYRDPRILAAIPPRARYAVFDVPAGRFLPQFFRALLVLQGPKARANIERLWAEIQAQHGFDVDRDFLPHLGRRVILHNDPPHPLRLPLAVTTLIEIRQEPQAVRKTVDAFCQAWKDALDATAARSGHPPPLRLERDADGVWYVRFALPGPGWLGLAGPAWTVTPRYLVMSWSPMALREYLDNVGDGVRGPAAGPRDP
ncbi:MAG: hypothetical protein AB1601_09420 [Planctomycetota bacterium]